MRAWLITVGEPLPTDENPRLLRTGLLAERLLARGDEVVWWTSTFDHSRRTHRFADDVERRPREGLRLLALHGMGYSRSVSLRRVADHVQVARKFARAARREPKPDVILCSLPTLELCKQAVRYGEELGVPVALDVRDEWPDIFVELAPLWARGAAKLALAPLTLSARRSLARATAVLGVTAPFVDWGVAHAGRARTALDRDFPHGYDAEPPSEEALQAARQRWRARGLYDHPEELVACFFGVISWQFDLDTVIRAAELVRRAGVPFRFVLCGSGDRLESTRATVPKGLAVDLPGWVDRADIAALMERSSVGLAPYVGGMNYDGNLPNKPIEYMSSGLPIATSLTGLVRDLIVQEDCGFAYRPGDAQDLASKLVALAKDPARLRELRANAARLYQRRFVAERVYTAMAEHLHAIARCA